LLKYFLSKLSMGLSSELMPVSFQALQADMEQFPPLVRTGSVYMELLCKYPDIARDICASIEDSFKTCRELPSSSWLRHWKTASNRGDLCAKLVSGLADNSNQCSVLYKFFWS